MSRCWKSGWEIPPVQPPPKTYNDGLEAAAAYHDVERANCRNLYSAHGDYLASLEKASATAIRALKEPT